ncbi:hypothetical protein ABW19_dt0202383 [Dactylella cylindrospora]|nr:hypothetical protein ABW19_dt0202383 [Dactylella cylindrospora]
MSTKRRYANPAFDDVRGSDDLSNYGIDKPDDKTAGYLPETTTDRLVRQISSLRRPGQHKKQESSETLVESEGYEESSKPSFERRRKLAMSLEGNTATMMEMVSLESMSKGA